MIRLQYPNINGNSLCDGRIHNITPLSISRIEDLEIFLMEYYDESKRLNCTTILYRMPTGEIYKIPLLNYDLLFSMMNNGELRLTNEDLFDFFTRYYSNPNSYIGTKQPVQDFQHCLAKTRAAIILYIDENGNIFYKDGNTYIKVDGNLLSRLMESYDIEWRRKGSDTLASKLEIDGAIHKTMGHMIKQNPQDNGLSVEERYKIGNIYHYSVSYQYTDEKGHRRGNLSI